MQSNAAKRVAAFNPSRYERAFDVPLVLSGTVFIS